MEAARLQTRLESGRSIESIAREAGKAASTVAYWVNKHGLTSTHTDRHAPRGPIERAELEAMLAEGLTIRAMAERLERSYSTGRHWMAKHGLATPRGVRLAETSPARAAGDETVEANCPVHGPTLFIRRGPQSLPMPPVPHGRRRPPTPGDQADARRRGRRRMRALRL